LQSQKCFFTKRTQAGNRIKVNGCWVKGEFAAVQHRPKRTQTNPSLVKPSQTVSGLIRLNPTKSDHRKLAISPRNTVLRHSGAVGIFEVGYETVAHEGGLRHFAKPL
jgi:hypothetical protein